MSVPLIETRHLKKYFNTPHGLLHAVEDVNVTIEPQETLGVVGESGCGKSTLGRVMLGLLSATEGEILFKGQDIASMKGKERKQLCTHMQMIFQDPYTSLNPRSSIGDIISDPLIVMGMGRNRHELREKVGELMEMAGLPSRYFNAYPHELDGGRRQRVGIARALALSPEFIICDEPVSALDVSIQAQILNLLMDLQEKNGLSYMFITHNLCVVKHISTNIMVMYMGQVVEYSPKQEIFTNPKHPYTQALLAAIPSVDITRRRMGKESLKGEVTNPINPPPGCRFASRCAYARPECSQVEVPQVEVSPNHIVCCHLFK